jgi:SMODS-associating 2TM, beta-strand rich effector domain
MAPVVSKKDDAEVLPVFLALGLAAIIIYLVSSDTLTGFEDMLGAYFGRTAADVAAGLNPVSIMGVLGVLYWLFASYLWRPFARPLGIARIEGRWEGEITSDKAAGPIKVDVTIEQKWRKLNMKFVGGEFTSHVILAAFDEDSAKNDRMKYLYFCYKNGARDHIGTSLLTIVNPSEMVGTYYTNRGEDGSGDYSSKGRIVLKKVPVIPAR